MIKRGFRPSPSGGPTENPNPKLCALFNMGDEANELGWLWLSALGGTVVPGAFSGSQARRFPTGQNASLVATLAYPWTVMFYINLHGAGAQGLFFRDTTQLRVNTTDITFMTTGGVIYAQASVSLSLDTWYHIAVSCGSANGQWKMWLNGSPLTLSTNSTASNLGSAGTNIPYFINVSPASATIDIDHFKAYKVQLSTADVVAEMNKKVW